MQILPHNHSKKQTTTKKPRNFQSTIRIRLKQTRVQDNYIHRKTRPEFVLMDLIKKTVSLTTS